MTPESNNLEKEEFLLVGLKYFSDQFENLAEPNPLYDMTVNEVVEKGLVGERLFAFQYHAEELSLQETETTPEGMSGLCVFADGTPVGYIKKNAAEKVRALQAENLIKELSLVLRGGPYRVVRETQDGMAFEMEDGTAAMYGNLSVSSQKRSASGEAGTDSRTSAYIDTTYELAEIEEDYKERGFGLLLAAAALTFFYAAFSIPYWLLNRSASGWLLDLLDGFFSNRVLLIHAGMIGCGLLFNIIAMFVRSSFPAGLASLFYGLGVILMPRFVIWTGIQSLLCLIVCLQKKGIVWKVLLGLLSLAVLAANTWLYFGGDLHPYIPFLTKLEGAAGTEEETESEFWDEDDFWNEDESDFWDEDDFWSEDESDFWDDDWEEEWDEDESEDWDDFINLSDYDFDAEESEFWDDDWEFESETGSEE